MRTKGSCRFEPYFKVEVWHPLLLCWRPVPKSWPTAVQAERNKPEGKTRVMKITENGIQIYRA